MKLAKKEVAVQEIKIEKNVPFPVPVKGAPNKKYPLGEMEVGDSFFAPDVRSSTISGAFAHYEALGLKFSCRTIKDNSGLPLGVRVWRIA